MTLTIEAKIWLAIKSRIETIPLPFAVAWPAETFTPPYSASTLLPYIRAGRVSAAPVRELIAGGKPHTRTGFIILTLVHPLGIIEAGHAATQITDLAGQIAQHFRDGTSMQYLDVCVTITEYPHVVEGYESDGYINIPVRIPWRTFA